MKLRDLKGVGRRSLFFAFGVRVMWGLGSGGVDSSHESASERWKDHPIQTFKHRLVVRKDFFTLCIIPWGLKQDGFESQPSKFLVYAWAETYCDAIGVTQRF